MKKSILIICCAILMLTGTAQADPSYNFKFGPYISAMLGGQYIPETDIQGTSSKVSFDAGFGGGISAGYQWNSGWRVEAEGTYYSSNIDKENVNGAIYYIDGDLQMTTLMGNVLYEFTNRQTRLFSYIGAGAGMGWAKGRLKGGGLQESASCTIPIVQPLVGVGYRITDSIALDFGYRFKAGLNKMNFDGIKGDYYSHRMAGGVRFTF